MKDKTAAQVAYEGYVMAESARLLSQTRSKNSLLEDYRLFVTKEKSIYAVLNQCEGETTLRINCWYPESEEGSREFAIVWRLGQGLKF